MSDNATPQFGNLVLDRSLSDLGQFCDCARAVIVTDANVRRLYGHDWPVERVVEVGVGETSKSLATVEALYRQFAEWQLDRHSWVIGVGGGVVCDLTGFAAATYLRGLCFGFVPTTLLALVDAAHGGKNGVNFGPYKNQIGTIVQPRFVLCDPRFISTLSEKELRNGLAEIIKHALIADADYFHYLIDHCDDLRALREEVVRETIRQSIHIKMQFVTADVDENGPRKILNFGHTLGHAWEAARGISHGEAVAMGMMAATAVSRKLGMLSADDEARIVGLLRRAGFTSPSGELIEEIRPALYKDKKRRQETLDFVLLNGIGRAVVQSLTIAELEALLHDLR